MVDLVEVIGKAKVEKQLLKEFVNKAGWPSGSGVTSDSLLYDVDHARTSHTVVPAHFGFIKAAGTVKHSSTRTAMHLVGGLLGSRCNLTRRSDLRIRKFGPFVAQLHRNISTCVIDGFGAAVIFAIHEAIGRDLSLNDPAPKWEGGVAFNKFVSELSDEVLRAFPQYPDPVISPVVNERLKDGSKVKSVKDLRNVVLRDVAVGGIKDRHFEIG